jgi:hypothetical protein
MIWPPGIRRAVAGNVLRNVTLLKDFQNVASKTLPEPSPAKTWHTDPAPTSRTALLIANVDAPDS